MGRPQLVLGKMIPHVGKPVQFGEMRGYPELIGGGTAANSSAPGDPAGDFSHLTGNRELVGGAEESRLEASDGQARGVKIFQKWCFIFLFCQSTRQRECLQEGLTLNFSGEKGTGIFFQWDGERLWQQVGSENTKHTHH